MNNIFEILANNLSFSSAILCFAISIISTFISKKANNTICKIEEEKNVQLKINNKEIQLDSFDEKEIISLLEKLTNAKETNTASKKKDI